MAFEQAIYTDVTVEESVDGRSGFGFRAVSSGVTEADKAAVTQRMLHVVSSSWPMDKDPLSHPETLAYMPADGRFFFSRGRSTGATRSGRQGNQITRALFTDDSNDILPFVPAQLFTAPVWELEGGDSTELKPVPTPLEIPEEFEAEALLEWIKEEPSLIDAFGQLAAGLSQRGAKKTVLVCDNLYDAVRWFTLGSLTLSPQDALELKLRGFVDDLYNNGADLLAVHPKMVPSRMDGAVVVDVSGGSLSTPMEPEESAAAIVRWVRELDPFDALESIDLFRSWQPALGTSLAIVAVDMLLHGNTGDSVAASSGKSKWDTAIAIVRGLVEGGKGSDIATYLDELTEALSGHVPATPEEMINAAGVAAYSAHADVPGLTDSLVKAAIHGLSNNPALAGAWTRTLVTDPNWDWSAVEDPEQVARQLAYLASEEEIASADLGFILQALRPLEHHLTADALKNQVRKPLRRAVDFELAHPGHSAQTIDRWIHAEEAKSEIRASVTADFHDHGRLGEQRWSEAQQGEWNYIRPVHQHSGATDTDTEFVGLLAAAELSTMSPSQRQQAIPARSGELSPDLSMYVVSDATLPEDTALITTWIDSVGSDADLRSFIYESVNVDLGTPAEKVKKRNLETYEALLETLGRSRLSVEDARVNRNFLDAVRDHKENIPTMKERAGATFDRLKRFGRKEDR